MVSHDSEHRRAQEPVTESQYPLKATASFVNEKLGLYLSEEQQRGFAMGLLLGTALGAGLLAWNLMGLIRRNV